MLRLLEVKIYYRRKSRKTKEKGKKKERRADTGPGHSQFSQLCGVRDQAQHRKRQARVKLLFLDFDPSSHKSLSSLNISACQEMPNIPKLLPSTKQSNKKPIVQRLRH